MNERITLDSLAPNQKGTVGALLAKGSMRRRLLDLGFVEGTDVECVGTSPFGDPCAYLVRGAVVAIRREDCQNILIRRGGDANGTDEFLGR